MSKELTEADELVLEEGANWEEDPFTAPKLFGVALAGVIGSLLLYYVYARLEPERREKLKESVMTAVRSQIRSLGGDETED